MKLILENFRCWKSQTFEFSDQSFILLKGNSGGGKSTILTAIQYVLYGGVRNICSYNEKKAKVILEYSGYKITRTNIPSRLLLTYNEETYEDDAAQAIINEKWGLNFNITSYITQKNAISFYNLSVNEKMNYLQSLILGKNDDIENIKDKTREYISVCKKELTKATTEYELLLSQFSGLPEIPFQEPPFKIKKDFLSDLKRRTKKWKIVREEIIETEKLINSLHQKNNLYIKNSQIHKQNNLELEDIKFKLQNVEKIEIPFLEFDITKEIEEGTEAGKQIIIKKNLLKSETASELTEIENQTRKETLEKVLNELPEVPNKSDVMERKKKAETDLKNIDKSERFTMLEKSLEEEEREYEKLFREYNQKINISTDYSSDEITDGINIFKQIEKIKSELNNIKMETIPEDVSEQIKELENQLKQIEESKKIRKCPKCEACFRIENDKIILSSSISNVGDPVDIKSQLISLKKQQSEREQNIKKNLENTGLKNSLENKLKTLMNSDNYFEDWSLSDLETELSTTKNAEDQKRLYKSKLKELQSKKKINSIKREMEELQPITKNEYNRNELCSQISEYNQQLKAIDELQSKREKLLKEIKSIKLSGKDYKNIIEKLNGEIETLDKRYSLFQSRQSQIKEYSEKLKEKEELDKQIKQLKERQTFLGSMELDLTDVSEELAKKTEVLSELKKKDEKYHNSTESINKYKEYLTSIEEQNRRKSEIAKFKKIEEDARRKLSVAEKFMNKVLESESHLILSALDNLNNSINYYLDKFFPNDTLTINITPFKETRKDVKYQINVVIGYQGVTTDLSNLSGGEYDRVILATVLAFNNVFGNDILLLDESISSLDEGLTEDILEVLYETLQGKLVILVAHQISEGIFDYVIDVEKLK